MIAHWIADRLVLDGDVVAPGGLPRAKSWRNRTAYIVGPPRWRELVSRYLRSGDRVAGPVVGRIQGADVATTGGRWRLVSAAAWDLPADPDTAHAQLDELRDAAEEAGVEWGATAATVAGRLVRELVPSTQLPARWRARAHESIHQGPMVALRASAAAAWYVDRRAAFLRHLGDPLPVPGSWASVDLGAHGWRDLCHLDGLVRARVRVHPRWALNRPIAPLPTRTAQGTLWALGELVGTWPIPWLRWATEAGAATVTHLLDVQICRVEPLALPLRSRLEEIPHKVLRRLLYTRAWGSWAASDWATGALDKVPNAIEYKVAGKTIYWLPPKGDRYNHFHPPTYRPDWAAYVACGNGLTMSQTLADLDRSDVAMVHVDAIATTTQTAKRRVMERDPDGWSTKGEDGAPLRVFAAGTYRHGDRCRAMGLPRWRQSSLSESELMEHAKESPTALRSNALCAWSVEGPHGDAWAASPATNPTAVAAPRIIAAVDADVLARSTRDHTWKGELWTRSGWRRKVQAPA